MSKLSRTQWLVVTLLFLTLILGLKVLQLSRDLSRTNVDLSNIAQTALARTAAQGQQASAERVAVDPLKSLVYLPEFRIKLPYDGVSKTIAYSMRNDNGIGGASSSSTPEADVSTITFMTLDKPTQMNCSDLVRLKLEAKANPYSPHEKPDSVHLADGRVLQIYQSSGVKECQQSWNLGITPEVLAAEFKQAQSY